MRRKGKTTIYDIGSLSVTPVTRVEGHITSLREFQKQYDAEEKAKSEAPIRKIEHDFKVELTKDRAENGRRIAKLYSLPVADIEDLIRHGDAPADPLGLPVTETPFSMKDFESSVTKFIESCPTLGVTFNSDAARRRFTLYAFVAADQGTVIDPQTLTVILARCMGLNLFSGEVTGELAKPVEQQPVKPEPTFDDLLNSVSGESREGRKALINAAVDAALTGEVRQMWQAFEASLYQNFNGFVLTQKQGETIYTAMTSQGMNFLRAADFDRTRVALVRSGDLPSHLIYPTEQVAIDMESADLSRFDVRQDFNRRIRQLG